MLDENILAWTNHETKSKGLMKATKSAFQQFLIRNKQCQIEQSTQNTGFSGGTKHKIVHFISFANLLPSIT
jgi:hypothetical protein